MPEIGLVSCVKTKRSEPARPKDLYTSPYFKKMRAYAERHHDDWWILSAEHGLLNPDGPPIAPYDQTLSGAPIATRRAWAEDVVSALDEQGLLADDVTLVIHAGTDYYGQLVPLVEGSDTTIELPTEGLGLGEKQAWYDEYL